MVRAKGMYVVSHVRIVQPIVKLEILIWQVSKTPGIEEPAGYFYRTHIAHDGYAKFLQEAVQTDRQIRLVDIDMHRNVLKSIPVRSIPNIGIHSSTHKANISQ